MKKYILLTLLVALFVNITSGWACTTAVISGKFTADGRPLLWKNRDSDDKESKIMIFRDGKYSYVGLLNASDKENDEIWIGYNSAGFAIMNSASYNLKTDSSNLADLEGKVMRKALQECATIDEFEALLRKLPKPLGVEANFGVIDAKGGAAYFETNNTSFVKIDVNDTRIAPMGYVIRTNYSFTGRPDEGFGYIRYMQAEKLMSLGSGMNAFTPSYLIQGLSRNLEHGLTHIDVRDFATDHPETPRFMPFEDYIPRYSTSSSVVIQGIKNNEPVSLTTMYAAVGWPCASVAIPVWLASGSVPRLLAPNSDGKSEWCTRSLEWKKAVFPITRGSGTKYININALYNPKGTGIMQQLALIEKQIMDETTQKLDTWRKQGSINTKEAADLYNHVEQVLKSL
ncbi:MAG TPA: hypothetical protein VHO90_14730 [Bacteroidales bacterium]|nr:hypothetical protein [Bacteroidales bacterium]